MTAEAWEWRLERGVWTRLLPGVAVAHSGEPTQRRNKLPLPDELQVRVRAGGVRYLDARWKKQKVSLELDGGHHMEVQHWDADTLRSLQLAVAARGTGEQQLRLTRANLRHDEPKVADLLRTLLS